MRTRTIKLSAIAAMTGLVLSATGATALTFINGSFEAGPAVPSSPGFTTVNGGDSTSILGWTVGGNSVDYIGSYWQASNGTHSIDLNGNGQGTISQVISGLTIGQEYTVKFDIAGNPDGAPATKAVDVSAASGSGVYTFNLAGNTKTSMGWITQAFAFIATQTSATLTFASLHADPYGAALDNVSVSATPLPAALPLFGTVLSGFGFFSWLRRRRLAA